MSEVLTRAELVGKVSALNGAKFASFVYTAKRNGEVARHTIILGASYDVMMPKDLTIAQEKFAAMTVANSTVDEIQAVKEIVISLQERIAAHEKGEVSANYTNRDTYVAVQGCAGLKIHKETGELFVHGMAQTKVVLQEGTPEKPVKSSAKTIAKNSFKHEFLRESHFRQFSLLNIITVKMNGETLEIETL